MPETRWRLTRGPYFEQLDIQLVVDTDAPAVVEMIEDAMDGNGIYYEPVENDDARE